MIRIGIIGSQSMHSRNYASLCNSKNSDGESVVNAICGIDDTAEHTAAVAAATNIEHIVDKPEDLKKYCDAVMVLTRCGDNHIEYSLPFIREGYPVFIDKPVCVSEEDISVLEAEVNKRNCIVTGGSAFRYNSFLQNVKGLIYSGEFGDLKGISFNYSCDIESPYNGIYFYACHSVEMMRMLLGDDIASIQTIVSDRRNFSVFVKYEDKFANIINTVGNEHFLTVYGSNKNQVFTISEEGMFEASLKDFVQKINEKTYTKNIKDLTAHVRILQAIEKSINTKKEIIL